MYNCTTHTKYVSKCVWPSTIGKRTSGDRATKSKSNMYFDLDNVILCGDTNKFLFVYNNQSRFSLFDEVCSFRNWRKTEKSYLQFLVFFLSPSLSSFFIHFYLTCFPCLRSFVLLSFFAHFCCHCLLLMSCIRVIFQLNSIFKRLTPYIAD